MEGDPVAKGSMRAYAVKRGRGWRGVLTHSEQSKRWEQQIRAQVKWEGERLNGPLMVDLTFLVARPKTVSRKYPSVVPDIDKLVRAVLDGLQGTKREPGVIQDDSRVVNLSSRKRYVEMLEVAGVLIKVWEL